MKNKLHIFDSPKQTAEVVAGILSEKINRKDGNFCLAISGGSTPKILFEILASEYSEKINWEKLKLFWVDERCVPPSDDESNFKMTYNALLKNIDIPKENVFRMKGENNPENEAIEYRKILKNNLPEKNNLPCFDLILLGMGEDGHTASIFPNNLLLLYSEETVVVSQHPSSGQTRITLTGNVIKNAEEIFFIITGKSKKEILRQILEDEKSVEKYPSYHILSDTNAEIYADKDAVVCFF